MNKLKLVRFSSLAGALAISALSLAPLAAHADPYNPSGNQTTVANTYATGDPVSIGVTSATSPYGNLIDQRTVATDYGQISNIFLTRFTPALVCVGIGGAVMLAASGGVRMVHGWLRGSFN